MCIEVKRRPFMSTDVRPCLNDDQNHETLPGPGAYDLNFREELKTLGKI